METINTQYYAKQKARFNLFNAYYEYKDGLLMGGAEYQGEALIALLFLKLIIAQPKSLYLLDIPSLNQLTVLHYAAQHNTTESECLKEEDKKNVERSSAATRKNRKNRKNNKYNFLP